MTTTIHTARYNDQVFTRTSKSRTYSHVVLGRDSYEQALAGAQSKGWAKTDASNYRWTVATAEGRAEYGWNRTPERIAEAQAELQGINSVEDYLAAATAERVARVEAKKAAGGFDTYGVIGWTSRLDLAQKLQGQSQGRYAHVVIVEAERTTKEPKGQPEGAEAPVATEEAAPAAPEAADLERADLVDAEGGLWTAEKTGVGMTALGDRTWDVRRAMGNRSSAMGGCIAFYAASLEEAQAAIGIPGGEEPPVKTSQELLASIENPTAWDTIGIAILADREAKAAAEAEEQSDADIELALDGYELRRFREGTDGYRIAGVPGCYLPTKASVVRHIAACGEDLGRTIDQVIDWLLAGDRVWTHFGYYQAEVADPTPIDDRVYDEHGQPLLVIERDHRTDLDTEEQDLPVTTTWLTTGILEACAGFAGHRYKTVTLNALGEGKRCYSATHSYVLAQEEADEPQDSYQGVPERQVERQLPLSPSRAQEVVGTNQSHFQGVSYRPYLTSQEYALVEAFWLDPATPGTWSFNDVIRHCAKQPQGSLRAWTARFDGARAPTSPQVTQDELQGLTLVVSGAFIGTNGPKALTVDELHFMAACEGQSARQVLARLKAGQVIEGSCTYRYLAEASSNAWAA